MTIMGQQISAERHRLPGMEFERAGEQFHGATCIQDQTGGVQGPRGRVSIRQGICFQQRIARTEQIDSGMGQNAIGQVEFGKERRIGWRGSADGHHRPCTGRMDRKCVRTGFRRGENPNGTRCPQFDSPILGPCCQPSGAEQQDSRLARIGSRNLIG